jgi:bis(5'-nucleosyl)-tetraphosphatase (symmetrical)
MALYAIGDVQGCDRELGQLLKLLEFSPERDRVWFVGDLVNRGPDSLGVLRRVRNLGHAANVTLGNHDLHLLAAAYGDAPMRSGDTLEAVLRAPDRDQLLDWLLNRPLMHQEPELGVVLLHAGLPPEWDVTTAAGCAREFEQALRRDPRRLFAAMYGDQPDRWQPSLGGADRLRFIVNCFTRLRYLDADGRLALRAKGSPKKAGAVGLTPWFAAKNRAWRGARVVFGHWSTLGFFRNDDVIGLDTGCVWGGTLSAIRLDAPDGRVLSVDCGVPAAG